MTSIFARIVTIFTGLITVPLTLKYLGAERFGLWMTLTSFVALLPFADLGLGIGLQNAMAECYGREDRENPSRYLSSALALMCMFALLITAASIFVLPLLPLSEFFVTADDAAKAELLPTAQVIGVVFAVSLPSGLISNVLNAHQQGYWGNILLIAGNLLSLVLVLWCVYAKCGLPSLAGAFIGGRAIVMLFSSSAYYITNGILTPRLAKISLKHLTRVMKTSSSAVGAQLGALAMVSGPPIVIANTLGTAAVTPFALTQRLLSVAAGFFVGMLMPLWPAYTEAAQRGDSLWVRQTFYRTLKIWIIIQAPIILGMICLGRWAITVWTGNAANAPTLSLVSAATVLAVFHSLAVVIAMPLNGLDKMFGQATYGLCFSALALWAAWQLADTVGTAGIVWIIAILGAAIRSVFMYKELVRLLGRNIRDGQIGIKLGIETYEKR